MLNFVKFKSVANMRAYGLGVQEYTLQASSGERAIGHGGGNIGTTTYMVYIPEHHVSIVVMINAFPNEGADEITKGLIKAVLKDLKAYSISNLIKAYSVYFIVAVLAIIYWSIFWIIRMKKKKRKPIQ
jgi:CubicO group peptidase (beta-lactamase class C family)